MINYFFVFRLTEFPNYEDLKKHHSVNHSIDLRPTKEFSNSSMDQIFVAPNLLIDNYVNLCGINFIFKFEKNSFL